MEVLDLKRHTSKLAETLTGRNRCVCHRALPSIVDDLPEDVHMRTTLEIDEQLLEQAAQLTGVSEKTALVRSGLEALIALESAPWLVRIGGTEKDLRPIPRRRSAA